jgi:hypothetical protein
MLRKHAGSGQVTPTSRLEEVLGVFADVAAPIILTSDVIDETGCGREPARQKLTSLDEQGAIERRKKERGTVVGGRSEDAVEGAA